MLLSKKLPDDIDKTLYNGNISEIYWRSNSDDVKRKYSFDYDKLNRLTSAVYAKPDAASPDTNAYNESMSYDQNGNITNLYRNGGQDQPINQPVNIDDLSYQYIANTNQLLTVSDSSNSTEGFKDVTSLEDYTYDVFGNQTKDDNKGITLLKYNHLNLPTEIVFENNNSKKITYLYDASGDKLRKTVTEGPQVITTDYLDGYQYRNAVLQFFPHAEGYIVNTQTTSSSGTKIDNYNYVYNYLDHLGNVRLSYAWDNEEQVLKIIEENGYYPYGLKHSGYNGSLEGHKAVANDTKVDLKGVPGGDVTVAENSNQTKFNHRQWQSEHGLNVTDMDFRQYDNAIGRFVCTDAITHYSQSPYHFANNNPIAYNDPSGLDGGYALSWASNTAYLNSSLGSSSNWGQSAVGGNAIGFMTAFESSVYTTSSPSGINGIIGYYARQNGYSGYSYTYSDSFNNIHGEGVGFQQYSTKGGAGIFGSLLNSMSSLLDWFGDNQSGYVFNDGSMKSDFTGDKIGKNGVLYGVTQNPWAPGAEVHNFNPTPFLKDFKTFSDIFSNKLEMTGVLSDYKNTTSSDIKQDSIINSIFISYYVVDKNDVHRPATTQFQRDSLMKKGGVRYYKYE